MTIDAGAARCRWGGERMDYDIAIDALCREDGYPQRERASLEKRGAHSFPGVEYDARWRITFRFHGGNADEVMIEDYHKG